MANLEDGVFFFRGGGGGLKLLSVNTNTIEPLRDEFLYMYLRFPTRSDIKQPVQ